MLLLGFSRRLGDGAFCVGSDAFCRLVWLGGLSGAPLLLCSVVFVQLVCRPVVFLAFFRFFTIFSLLYIWVGQPLFGLLQKISVNYFLLNEICA